MSLGTHMQHMYIYTHCKHTLTHTHLCKPSPQYMLMQSYIYIRTCACSYALVLYTQYNTNYVTHIYTHPKTDANLINYYIRIRRHACNGVNK